MLPTSMGYEWVRGIGRSEDARDSSEAGEGGGEGGWGVKGGARGRAESHANRIASDEVRLFPLPCARYLCLLIFALVSRLDIPDVEVPTTGESRKTPSPADVRRDDVLFVTIYVIDVRKSFPTPAVLYDPVLAYR